MRALSLKFAEPVSEKPVNLCYLFHCRRHPRTDRPDRLVSNDRKLSLFAKGKPLLQLLADDLPGLPPFTLLARLYRKRVV